MEGRQRGPPKKTESLGQFLRQELKKMTAFEAEGPKKSLLFNN